MYLTIDPMTFQSLKRGLISNYRSHNACFRSTATDEGDLNLQPFNLQSNALTTELVQWLEPRISSLLRKSEDNVQIVSNIHHFCQRLNYIDTRLT